MYHAKIHVFLIFLLSSKNNFVLALKIHISEDCKQILDKLGGYILHERGLTPIKASILVAYCFTQFGQTYSCVISQGKGEMKTYWLITKSLPYTTLNGMQLYQKNTGFPVKTLIEPSNGLTLPSKDMNGAILLN